MWMRGGDVFNYERIAHEINHVKENDRGQLDYFYANFPDIGVGRGRRKSVFDESRADRFAEKVMSQMGMPYIGHYSFSKEDVQQNIKRIEVHIANGALRNR